MVLLILPHHCKSKGLITLAPDFDGKVSEVKVEWQRPAEPVARRAVEAGQEWADPVEVQFKQKFLRQKFFKKVILFN